MMYNLCFQKKFSIIYLLRPLIQHWYSTIMWAQFYTLYIYVLVLFVMQTLRLLEVVKFLFLKKKKNIFIKLG